MIIPDVSLFVQYGTPEIELPRWRLRRWVRQAVNGVAQARHEAQTGDSIPELRAVALTLRLVDEDEGRELNRDFREKDYATNVLTFEYGVDPEGTASGDIVLCVPVLHKEAAEQHKSIVNHAAHLTVHGVLHALGYDHIDAQDAQDMEELEAKILHKMAIANPYQP